MSSTHSSSDHLKSPALSVNLEDKLMEKESTEVNVKPRSSSSTYTGDILSSADFQIKSEKVNSASMGIQETNSDVKLYSATIATASTGGELTKYIDERLGSPRKVASGPIKTISPVSSINSKRSSFVSPKRHVYSVPNLNSSQVAINRPSILNRIYNVEYDDEPLEEDMKLSGPDGLPYFQEKLTAKTIDDNRQMSVIYSPANLSQKLNTPESVASFGSSYRMSKKRCLVFGIGLVVLLLLLMIAISIPFVVMLYNGSESVLYRYFAAQPKERQSYIHGELANRFNLTEAPPREYFKLSTPLKHNNYFPLLISNTYQGLPEAYQQDHELVNLMNNTQLKNVFYGIDYNPRNVLYPNCGIKERDVELDLALLSQVTTRLRTYGTQCRQLEVILESIIRLNLNMTVALGVWISSDEKLNARQMKDLKTLLPKYPEKYIDAIYIGNEVLLRDEMTTQELTGYITEMKEYAKQLNWPKVQIGVSEIGSLINKDLIQASDIISSNIHPFFSGIQADRALNWTVDFIRQQIHPLVANSSAQLVLSEIGWPSGGGAYISSRADIESLQLFLNQWVCESVKLGYPWYWFEAFDEPWKQILNTNDYNWETQWGVFNSSRNLKPGLTLPECW